MNPEAAELQPGEVIEHLTIRRFIDAGGFGEVYEVKNAATGRREVLKILRKSIREPLRQPGETQREFERRQYARARFIQEAQRQGPLRHPHIVTIYAAGELNRGAEQIPYLLMELVRGKNLAQRLAAAGGALSWREACLLLAPIAEALVYLAQGEPAPETTLSLDTQTGSTSPLVHLDIKPENILTGEVGSYPQHGSPEVKLGDFGIAMRLDAVEERLARARTLGYAAPEVVWGSEPVGPAADIYSLGCTLFKLLAGAPPYEHYPNRTPPLGDPAPTRSALPPQVPPALQELLDRMLAPQAKARPQALEVSHGLQALAQKPAGKGVLWGCTSKRSADERPLGGRFRQRVSYGAAAGLLLLTTAGFAVQGLAQKEGFPPGKLLGASIPAPQPANPDLDLRRAEEELEHGRPAQARPLRNQVLESSPDNAQALRLSARLEVKQERWQEAQEQLERLIRRGEATPDDQLTLVDCRLNRKPPQAKEALATLHALAPEELEGDQKGRAAQLLYDTMHRVAPDAKAAQRQAEEVADRWLRQDPPPIPALKVKIVACLGRGTTASFSQARKACQQAIRLDDQDPESWLLSGTIAEALSRSSEAHLAYAQTLRRLADPAVKQKFPEKMRLQLKQIAQNGLRATG